MFGGPIDNASKCRTMHLRRATKKTSDIFWSHCGLVPCNRFVMVIISAVCNACWAAMQHRYNTPTREKIGGVIGTWLSKWSWFACAANRRQAHIWGHRSVVTPAICRCVRRRLTVFVSQSCIAMTRRGAAMPSSAPRINKARELGRPNVASPFTNGRSLVRLLKGDWTGRAPDNSGISLLPNVRGVHSMIALSEIRRR